MTWAAKFILLAAVFDLLDGMIARALKVTSPLGKQLDSLADLISFGLIPSLFLFQTYFILRHEGFSMHPVGMFSFMIVLFSALRLAKFNIDERQTSEFIGVPTPANTLLVVSLCINALDAFDNPDDIFAQLFLNNYFFIGMIVIASFLMVSELRLMSFKMKKLSWKENEFQWILLILATALILLLKVKAVPVIFLLYLILSLIKQRFTSKEN